MDRITIKLKKPITVGSRTIEEVTVREPVAGDLRGAPSGEMDRALHVIGKVTGLSSVEVDQLSMADMAAIADAQQSFQEPSPETGTSA